MILFNTIFYYQNYQKQMVLSIVPIGISLKLPTRSKNLNLHVEFECYI